MATTADERLQTKLWRIERLEAALLETRQRRLDLVVAQTIRGDPAYNLLKKHERSVRRELHQLHLQTPRKIQAAETCERKAAEFRAEARDMEERETAAQAQLVEVERQVAVLKEQTLAKIRSQCRPLPGQLKA